MDYSSLNDYAAFCEQSGLTGRKAIEFLLDELSKLKGEISEKEVSR